MCTLKVIQPAIAAGCIIKFESIEGKGRMVDLHMHTTASDGTDTPSQVIKKCRKLNLELCSITDHDTIDSQKEAIELSLEIKQQYLTGVEISVIHEGELHILGYGIDIENESLVALMEELRALRVARIHAIIKKLHEHNIAVSFDDVQEYAKGNTFGRPHVASALVKHGYAADMQEAFTKYLNEKGLCYVKRHKLSVQDTVKHITDAGGIPVLAHPKFVKTDNFDHLFYELVKLGVKGIEAYYPAHSDSEVERYVKLAQKYNLIVTCGSDYHGTMRSHAAIACEKREGSTLKRSIEYLKKLSVYR